MAAVTTAPLVSLQNILVATDFSPCSKMALTYAAALARQEKARMFLAHVVPLEPLSPIPMDAGPGTFENLAHDARTLMKKECVRPELAGIEFRSLIEHGDFWPAIDTLIHDQKIDLVVVGTHGREGVSKLLMGSTAEEVFRRAACPVITVGPHVTGDCLHEGRLHRVLFATDFSAASLHALPHAAMLAMEHLAPVTFLHVLASAVPDAEFVATNFVERELDEARTQLSEMVPKGIRADIVVEVGIPAEIIARVARAQNASLIAMGVHRQSVFAATHLPWSTAHRVVCEAPCPVLTVR